MNELMITVLENDWLLYVACGAAALGCLIQIILSVIYNRSLSASERMRSTKIAWLRQMKTRYESGYEWNNRIRNVALFVDKNIGRRKWMGVYLKTWEELSGMMLWLVLAIAVAGALCAATYTDEKTISLNYLVTGAVLALVLRGLTVLANLKEKENLLRTNLCDYFENTLQGEAKNRRKENRREQEAYFELQQREELACAIACAEREKITETGKEPSVAEPTEQNSIDVKLQQKQEEMKDKAYRKEMAKKAKAAAKSNKQALRREEKQAKKEAKSEKKQEKRAAKEAAKLQQKQQKEQKRVDKLTKRMERMQIRLDTAATAESVSVQNNRGGKKEESARLKREQLKQKVEVTPAQEDQIIADVLREFLA